MAGSTRIINRMTSGAGRGQSSGVLARGVLSLLVLAGCASQSESGSPDGARSATPKSDSTGLVVAVIRDTGALELYNIDHGRHAHLLRTLKSPLGTEQARQVTLASGPNPRVCGIFLGQEGNDSPGPSSIACYQGTTLPTVIRRSENGDPATKDIDSFTALSIRPDGRALVWLDSAYQQQTDLFVAELDSGAVSNARRIVTSPETPGGRGSASQVDAEATSVAWAGSKILMFVLDRGDAVGLRVQPVDEHAEHEGWLSSGRLVSPSDPGFAYFDRVTSADASSALAVEGGPSWRESRLTRAVRLDLATGRVIDVIASPAIGRGMLNVSGGDFGIVYTTGISLATGVTDERFYLKFPGDAHGQPILDLPSGTRRVVAQP